MSSSKKCNRVTDSVVLPLESSLVVRGLIYSIVNEKLKLVLVGSTSNLYTAIGRLIDILETGSSEYGTLKEDLKDCIVSVLEIVDGEGNTKVRTKYWMDHYSSRNYIHYKSTTPVQYKVISEMHYHHGLPRYFVYLQNKRGDRTTIAMFEKRKEMILWIREHYPDTSRVGRVVYHESLK